MMLTVTSHESPDACEPLIDGWNALFDGCTRANPFYAPEMLLTAWHCYGDRRVRLLTIWDGDFLAGLLPVCTNFNFSLFPVLHTQAWRYRHCYSCMPLLAPGYEARVLQALCEYLRGTGRLFSLYDAPFEGEIKALPARLEMEEAQVYFDCHERACLLPARTGRMPFQSQIRTKRLKEYRRQTRSLEKLGTLEFTSHQSPLAGRQRLEAFFLLEQSGWKGRAQTALLSNEADRRFAWEALRQMADKGRLHVYELTLDGRPLAMLLVLSTGTELYTFKIAHDPTYARYSPGVLLMLECSLQWERETGYRMVDSCATPEHTLIDRLWYERRSMAKFHICGGDFYTRALLTLRKLGTQGSAVGKAA